MISSEPRAVAFCSSWLDSVRPFDAIHIRRVVPVHSNEYYFMLYMRIINAHCRALCAQYLHGLALI